MAKARILLVTNIFPPAIGGPATFIDRLAHALVAQEHRVTVVCSGEHAAYDPGDSARPFKVIRVSLSNRYTYEVEIRRRILEQLLLHSIVLVNGLEAYVAPLARLVRRRYVLKVVGDSVWEQARGWGFTNLTIDEFQRSAKQLPIIRRLSDVRDRCLDQAKCIVTPSEYLRGMVAGWGYPKHLIHVVPNGIPNDRPSQLPRRRVRGEPLQLVFCGRLTNWKGVETLLLAGRDMPDVHVHVIGDGSEWPMLTSMAAQLHLPNFSFHGRQSQEAVHRAFCSSHVFVLPSGYEGLSHTLLEAMHVGLACIVTSVGGNSEVVTNGKEAITVPYADVMALRSAIVLLRDNEDLRLSLGSNASRRAEEFSFVDTVRETSVILLNGEANERSS